MHDPGRVRGGDRVRDAEQQLDALPPRPLARCREPVVQRAAVDELAHEILRSVVLADVVHRHDMRMVQRRRRLGFLLEAPPRLRVGERRRQELDRDRTMQLRVGRAIDDAHAAAADHLVNLIAADSRAARQIGLRGRWRTLVADAGRILLREQELDGLAQARVARRALRDERAALAQRPLECGPVELADLVAARGVHGLLTARWPAGSCCGVGALGAVRRTIAAVARVA